MADTVAVVQCFKCGRFAPSDKAQPVQMLTPPLNAKGGHDGELYYACDGCWQAIQSGQGAA
jgi:ribosomal protein S26